MRYLGNIICCRFELVSLKPITCLHLRRSSTIFLSEKSHISLQICNTHKNVTNPNLMRISVQGKEIPHMSAPVCAAHVDAHSHHLVSYQILFICTFELFAIYILTLLDNFWLNILYLMLFTNCSIRFHSIQDHIVLFLCNLVHMYICQVQF